jgi:hypothetical protein
VTIPPLVREMDLRCLIVDTSAISPGRDDAISQIAKEVSSNKAFKKRKSTKKEV